MMRRFIGFDIGGTKCAVALGCLQEGHDLTIVARSTFPTEVGRGPGPAIERLLAEAHGLLAHQKWEQTGIEGIGISCGGPLDRRRGIILSPPNLPGWDRVPIVALLRDEFGIPACLLNDADACALAEWRYGAGRGTHNMVFCTFGTGFGAGLILNGRLYEGVNGKAGEIGHVRLAPDGPAGHGKRGSVEGFCSGGGLAQLARTCILEQWQQGRKVPFCADRAALEAIDARIVAEAARAGDQIALRIFGEVGWRLGQSLAVLVDVLDPEVIVIGSIFARCQDLLWPEAARAMEQEGTTCRVIPSALGDRLGDYAGLMAADCRDLRPPVLNEQHNAEKTP